MASEDALRPMANFSPSLWGDQFLEHDFDFQTMKNYNMAIEPLKNEVRGLLMSPKIQMVDAMNLIDTLERLGIAYHFENEIEDKLQEVFNPYTKYCEDKAWDLYTVALHFRMFRQHGYNITSDIFKNWIDHENGKFLEDINGDVRSLLSLYEATHLRVHGENALDHAHHFAITNMKSSTRNLKSFLSKQVEHALVQALHLGCPRIEARNFISIYEESEQKNETLLRFAKLDYNILQMLHKKELQEVSRWWKELNLISKYNYARDRVVECFFWVIGVYYEPQYSRARIMLAKLIAMTSIIDDTYDAYGTVDELEAFTKAIERWDIAEIDQLPEYLKQFYKALLELYQQIDDELAKEGRSYGTSYAIDALKELVRSYNVEAKWFLQGEYPPFEEYLNNGLISCSYYYHAMASLLGMKYAMDKEFKCLYEKPKMLVAGLINCRLTDDIASYEIEKERGQMVTGIECYMKEKDVTKEEAMAKIQEMATNAWKDINEECLKLSSYSRDVVKRIINMSRLIDVAYKNKEDGYTQPEKNLKPHIITLFVDPIKV